MGVLFLAIPETLLRVLRLPAAPAGWLRIIGLLALVIGAYDLVGARAESLPYIKASVPLRFGFAAGMTLLVVLGQMPATTLPLGAIDAAGAVWTMIALRDRRSLVTLPAA